MRLSTKGKTALFLIFLSFTALFFYTFRLKESLVFNNDSARDTLSALTLWQDKNLTLIGPPLSVGQYGIREMYFGSLSLYIGMLGLLIANLDPVGAILPNIFFMITSIPIFYLLTGYFIKEKKVRLTATTLYALSPIAVYHSRLFWNPNLIIPFSTWFWWLVIGRPPIKNTWLRFGIAGIIGGLMINLHYISVLPLAAFLLYLVCRKKVKLFLALTLGIVTGSLPLIAFEIKNNFYLTQALIYNFQNSKMFGIDSNLSLWENFADWMLILTGLKHGEFFFPPVSVPEIFLAALSIFFTAGLGWITFRLYQKKNYEQLFFLILTLTINLIAIKLTNGSSLYFRYLFPVYPLLIIFMSKIISINYLKNFGYLLFAVIVFCLINIVSYSPSIAADYTSLAVIEAVGRHIKNDNFGGNYNISANIDGGAQAIPFRYQLMRNATHKPLDIKSYENLERLYVISPNLEKIYQEKRWEFTATENLQLKSEQDFGEVRLFTFEPGKN